MTDNGVFDAGSTAIRWLGADLVATALFGVVLVRDRAANDTSAMSLGLLLALGLVMVLTGVAWLRWFSAVYKRVDNAGRARFSSGAIWIWAWLIPVAFLVLPKFLVNDVWWAADPPGTRRPPPAVVQWWWGLWVASGLVTELGRHTPVLYPVWVLLTVIDAVLAMKVVRVLSERAHAVVAFRVPPPAPVWSEP